MGNENTDKGTLQERHQFLVGIGRPGAYKWVLVAFTLDCAYEFTDDLPLWVEWIILEKPNGDNNYPILTRDFCRYENYHPKGWCSLDQLSTSHKPVSDD